MHSHNVLTMVKEALYDLNFVSIPIFWGN